ncbi:unnamed protein product [Acanthoscelides obtectus]|uniref:DDE Tnp4 domain-containing protein n=1 Tax=Acanthoscelides obtectus TaxID=200917 RepID=A0A9P0QES4_ACAOB|nr:unnamed protein product [Acanthoscelides obtectus]
MCECAFGILANRWRIFHRPLDVKLETAIWIVKACTVLHNFVREKTGLILKTLICQKSTLNNLPKAQNIRGGLSANSIRTTFADYFLTEAGSVSWQDEAIATTPLVFPVIAFAPSVHTSMQFFQGISCATKNSSSNLKSQPQ